MSNAEILALFERVGGIITESHIVYTSGRHGTSYVNKDALFPYTAETSFVCSQLAQHFRNDAIEVVAGPTLGGVILSQWVAYHLSAQANRPILAVYAEEEGEGATRRALFKRGYADLVANRRVLVVEDVVTTGESARRVARAVEATGGTLAGVGVLCNRGGITAAVLQVPRMVALVELALESWDEHECPLCRDGVPINTRVGKGAAFLAKQQQQAHNNTEA